MKKREVELAMMLEANLDSALVLLLNQLGAGMIVGRASYSDKNCDSRPNGGFAFRAGEHRRYE